MKSVVTKPTRLNPDRILDNIIIDLSKYYHCPEVLPPIDADPGSGGKPSDHLTVVMAPIATINNKPARNTRDIWVRPMTCLVIGYSSKLGQMSLRQRQLIQNLKYCRRS